MGDKPYPWRCGSCGEQAVTEGSVSYKASIKHEGRLHEIEIPQLVVPKCEKCGELSFNNRADEQINAALRNKLGLMQPDEIRQERNRLGLNQEELAELTGVAKESISRWENGAQIQSRSTDKLLRIFFRFGEVRNWLAGDDARYEPADAQQQIQEHVTRLLEAFSTKAMQIPESPDVFARMLHPWKFGKLHLSLWHALSAYVHERNEDEVKELTYRVAIHGIRGFRRKKSDLLPDYMDATSSVSLSPIVPRSAPNRMGSYFDISHGHQVSHENSLEFWLVSNMLLSPPKIDRVTEIVKAEDFDEDLAREFFEKMVDSFRNQNATDTASLVKCLQTAGMAKPKLHFLFTVFSSLPSGERVMELAEMVRNKSIFRRLVFETQSSTE